MRSQFEPRNQRYFELGEVPNYFDTPERPLRLLILADDQHPANVVQDHIRSFSEYSVNHISVVNTRNVKDPGEHISAKLDALLIHYSVFVIAETYLSTAWQEFISTFMGAVAVIHEDEYQKINSFKQKFTELGIQAVFSCLDSKETMERVYGGNTMPKDALFFSCLPGYIAPQLLAVPVPPTLGRPLDLIYRGRILRPELGRLAQDKRLIGEQMRRIAQTNGLTFDISSAEEARIYGPQWPQFLRSGKAMLGVEGGASIFDFDGKISEAVDSYTEEHPNALFDEIWQNVLVEHEGNIVFHTITPKFFEAIAAKTVLILYPGKYSNVLIPGRHFIQLERDGSNVADVIEKLKNDAYLQEMADRTYEEILQKDELRSQFYVNQIDRVLWSLANSTPAGKVLRLGASMNSIKYELQQDLASTQQGLASSQMGLAVIQSALASTQRELASTQRELASTQQELASTQQDLASMQQDLASNQQGLASNQQGLASNQQALAVIQTALASTQGELASTQQERASTQQLFGLVSVKLKDLEHKVSSEAHLAELYSNMLRSKIRRLLGFTK